LGIVVIEVENPELVDAICGNIVVVSVREGEKAVGGDAPPPGSAISGGGNLSRGRCGRGIARLRMGRQG